MRTPSSTGRLLIVLPFLVACGATAPPDVETGAPAGSRATEPAVLDTGELLHSRSVSSSGRFSATESRAVFQGESEGVALLMIWRRDRALAAEWGWRPVAWSPVADILLVRQAVPDHVLHWALVDLRDGTLVWSEHLDADRLSYDAFVFDAWSEDGKSVRFFSHFDPDNERRSVAVEDYLPDAGGDPRSH